MGMLYRRKRPDGSLGPTYWVKYYVNGRPVRESTGTAKEQEAKRFLKEREGHVATGQPVLPRADRIRVEELLDDLKAHYETTGRRTLREAEVRLVPLRAFFTGRRAAAINGAVLTEYALLRQAAPVANGTINRELSVLGTAFRLGAEQGKVLRRPTIHLLKEAAPRQGFFERPQFEAVRKHLPEDLQLAVTIMYLYGWRLGEVMTLTLSQVDQDAGTLRLEPGMTKNQDGRVVYLTPELKTLLSAQIGRVKALSRKLGRVLPFMFTHLHGCYTGAPRRDFRKTWAQACQAVGLVGALKHDFRRTAVRNMERAGVPRSVAIKISGHRTESVYRRYAIVCEADLQEAMRRLAGTFSGTAQAAGVDRHS